MEDQAQSLIDATTAAFKAGKIPSNPFGGTAKGGAAIPPPSILQTRPGMPPPSSGPPGQPPPLLGPPGGRPPMLPPGMMMPPGGPPPGGGPGMPPGMPGMPPGMPPGMLASLNRLRPPMGMPPLMPPPGMGGLMPRPLIPQQTATAPPTSQPM